MLALNPLMLTAGIIRATGDIWSRNLRFAQVFVDATLHQQRVFTGIESPRPVVAPRAVKAKPASRARRKPAAPRPIPKRKSGPDTNDMPV